MERIGIAAMRQPVLFALGLLFFTAFSVFNLFSVTFNGSVTGVLPKQSDSFIAYEAQKSDFRNFSRDVAIIVRSPRLTTADGLSDLRDFQLDMSLVEGVSNAISVMAAPTFNDATGEFETYFPVEFEDDQHAEKLLARLVEQFPQAHSLISSDKNAAVVLVALDLSQDDGNDAATFSLFRNIQAEAADLAPEDFDLLFSGLTPIGLTILETLLTDQTRLTLFGLLLGAIIAVLFFRSIVAALFCALPPLLTAIWAIGFFGLTGVSVTYMTTILPTLALVLAYADGIVLFHRWNKMNREGSGTKEDAHSNLKEAVLRVGPASALTSLTTAFALSSFAFSSSEALVEFAWVGVVLVLFAFLAVIVSVPVLGLALIRLGWISTGARTSSPFRFGSVASNLYESSPKTIAVGALLAVGAMFFVHSDLEPDYRITDLLPRGSATLEAETYANDVFGGRSLIFFSIPVVGEGGVSNEANRQRLEEITDLLAEPFGAEKIYSIEALWRGREEAQQALIGEKLEAAPEAARRGYISYDGSKLLVSLRIPSSQSISETQVLLDDLHQRLVTLPFYDEITVTGFPVLLATEFSDMINELRRNLLIAAGLGVLLIGFATRSLWLAAMVAVPNLFPILFVEAIIYFQIGQISVTEVVALTLAFGIAIDNAVHVINVFRSQSEETGNVRERLRFAVAEVAPALGASTMIICAGTAVALTSSLPILTTIGALIIATLAIALA
ncbi:MAG: MMPL family transporter, partial [Rhizobiaceae bacterium]|nr:MMPL family transporter [Rhizobiaceae bacterium]